MGATGRDRVSDDPGKWGNLVEACKCAPGPGKPSDDSPMPSGLGMLALRVTEKRSSLEQLRLPGGDPSPALLSSTPPPFRSGRPDGRGSRGLFSSPPQRKGWSPPPHAIKGDSGSVCPGWVTLRGQRGSIPPGPGAESRPTVETVPSPRERLGGTAVPLGRRDGQAWGGRPGPDGLAVSSRKRRGSRRPAAEGEG